MVIRSTLRTFAIAPAVAMLAACASGADVVRHVPVESAAVVHAVPAPQGDAFADDDADAFWDSIGEPNLGFVETHP